MHWSRYLLMAAGLLFVGTANAQDVCTGILSYTGRDQSTETRDNAVAQSIYSQYCQGNAARSSNNTSVGLDAIVNAIPVKFSFGGSSSQEKLSNFCKTYDSRFAQYSSEHIDRSTVVRESLNAFGQCINAISRDIYFAPRLGRTKLSVDVRRGSEDARLEGVSYDTALLTCLVPDASGSGLVKADTSTTRILGGAYLPIVCDRVPQPSADGTQNYPATEIQIITNRSVFLLPIAADALLPDRWATDISKRISDLEVKESLFEARESAFEAAVGKGRVLAIVDVRDGKIEHSSPGVTYTVAGREGTITFPNPKGLQFVPVLTDIGSESPTGGNNYITATHFIQKNYSSKSNSFILRQKALDTGGEDRTYAPGRFTAIVIGFEEDGR